MSLHFQCRNKKEYDLHCKNTALYSQVPTNVTKKKKKQKQPFKKTTKPKLLPFKKISRLNIMLTLEMPV